MPSPAGLWHDRAFLLYFSGYTISSAGTWITYVALPILVYQMSGSAFQTSLVTALEVAPYLVFGLLAGAVADRVNRRRLMVACNLLNVLVIGSVPAAHALDLLTLPHVYAAAFVATTAFVWFDAANFGALPALFGKDRLVSAQSAIWASSMAMGVVAPSVGGLLVATLGAATTLSLDAASYLLSASALLSIPRAFSTSERAPVRLRADIAEGLRFLWGQPVVRTLTLLGFGVSFSAGALLGLLVVFAVEELGLSNDDGQIGLLFTAGAAGALVASLLLPRLTRLLPAARITLIGLPLNSVFLLAVAASPTFAAAVVAVFFFSVFQLLVILNGITLRQLVTPDALQSRVNTAARMVAYGGTPFGALAAGALAELTDARIAIGVTALAVTISAVSAWLSPLRAERSMHGGADRTTKDGFAPPFVSGERDPA